jgi:cytochrome c biogenesis protein ResB
MRLTKRRILGLLIIVAIVALIILIATGVLHGLLLTLFIWPSGIVVGNLIASAMWQPQWFLSLHHKANKHHTEAIDLAKTHHQEKLDQAERHHQELKQHITDTIKQTD